MPFDGREFGRHSEMLRKLGAVTELLGTEERWYKRELKTRDGRRCILGALMHVGGNAQLSEIILCAARELTGKPYRGVESFNDGSTTTHRLVLAVLSRSRDIILSGRVPVTNRPTVEARVRRFYAALARIG
jgi:hypothetical protein